LYKITDSQFYNNEAYLGGAVFINNPKLVFINNNKFFDNNALNNSDFAKSGMGGGLYYTCGLAYLCKLTVAGDNYFK
jgi:hypothetical protein